MDTVVTLNTGIGTNSNTVRALASRSLRVLFDPARFFRHELPELSLNESLTFGIGNAWLASVFAFFLQTINSLLLSQLLDRWMQRLVAMEEGFLVWSLSANSFLWAAGLLLLGPFLLLLRAAFSTLGLYVFARLLIEDRPGAPEPVTFQGTFRIQAVALLGQWFAIVPVFGPLLSFIVSLILTVTGVRERFQTSTRRAVAVVFAPFAILFVMALLVFVFFVVMLSQFTLQDLMEIDSGL